MRRNIDEIMEGIKQKSEKGMEVFEKYGTIHLRSVSQNIYTVMMEENRLCPTTA